MDPLVSLRLLRPHRRFAPGEVLECEYQVDFATPRDLHAVEESVLWFTEGKGDTDLAVHYFHRRVASERRKEEPEPGLGELRRFQTRLPNSPLSYHGVIVQIRWCVRVRAFLRGRDCLGELPFTLGEVPAAVPAPTASPPREEKEA